MDENGFLARVGFDDLAFGGAGIRGAAGGLQQVDNALDFRVGQMSDDAGNGFEGLDFVAGNAIAPIVVNQGAELGADGFDVGAEELLLALTLNKEVGRAGRRRVRRQVHSQQCDAGQQAKMLQHCNGEATVFLVWSQLELMRRQIKLLIYLPARGNRA